MRILMVQTFYYYRGGDSTYMFNLTKLLEDKGHEVIPFAMHHPQNLPSPWSKYFVSEIDFPALLAEHSPSAAWKVMTRSIYSREARNRISSLIADTKPDIAHLHNLHGHLTISIIPPLLANNVPVVWTCHDYGLVCPNSSFLCGEEVCERCIPGRFHRVLLHRCKKGSYGASFVAMLTSWYDRIKRIPNRINRFITPSDFLRQKLIEGGFDPARVTWIPNFVDLDAYRPAPEKDYFLYIGRLSPEKGLDTLIDAVSSLDAGLLVIAGEGPSRERLEMQAASCGGRVEFAGFRSGDRLKDLIGGAQFVVLPSRCYENLPFAVMEAFASGKGVVASRMGGIPEMVDDGVNGLLFPAGDSEALAGCLKRMLGDENGRVEMGRKGREKAERLYEREEHYRKLFEVYMEESGRGAGTGRNQLL